MLPAPTSNAAQGFLAAQTWNKTFGLQNLMHSGPKAKGKDEFHIFTSQFPSGLCLTLTCKHSKDVYMVGTSNRLESITLISMFHFLHCPHIPSTSDVDACRVYLCP